MSKSDSTKLILLPKDIARFWAKVRKSRGCWKWTKCRSASGYGKMYVQGSPRFAHRISYTIHFGDIPEGSLVCHHCDTPACCRPDHLFLGSCNDNTQDAKKKGRIRRGENHGMAVLTENQVVELREEYASRLFTQLQIATKFGVSDAHVCGIVTGKFWKHTGGPISKRKLRHIP